MSGLSLQLFVFFPWVSLNKTFTPQTDTPFLPGLTRLSPGSPREIRCYFSGQGIAHSWKDFIQLTAEEVPPLYPTPPPPLKICAC